MQSVALSFRAGREKRLTSAADARPHRDRAAVFPPPRARPGENRAAKIPLRRATWKTGAFAYVNSTKTSQEKSTLGEVGEKREGPNILAL